jgi:O-antigen/teichoic acid export membrane protein
MRQSTRLIVNTIVIFGRVAITLGLSLVATRLIMGSLGEIDWGLLSALGASGLLLSLLSSSLTFSAQRHMAYQIGLSDQHGLREVFNTTLALFLALGTAIWLVGAALASPFLAVLDIPVDRETAAFWVFQLTLFDVVKTAWTTPFRAAANARQALVFLAIFDTATAVNRLLAGALLLLLSGDLLIKFAVVLFAGQIFIAVVLVICCLVRFEETRPRLWLFRWSRLREVGSFGGWAILLRVGWLLRLQGGTLLLNFFFGPVVNGAYALGVMVSNSLMKLAYMLMQVTQPAMTSAEARGNRQQVRMLCLFVSKYTVLASLCITVPMLLETETVLRLWLVEYPPYTETFVRLMLVWSTIALSVRGHDIAVMAVGKISRYATITTIINVSPLVVAVVWFKLLDLEPWALPATSIITSVLVVMYIVLVVGRIIDVPASEWVRRTLVPILVSTSLPTAAACGIHFTMSESILRAAAVVGVYGVLALPMGWFVLEPVEKQEIRRVISKVVTRFSPSKTEES